MPEAIRVLTGDENREVTTAIKIVREAIDAAAHDLADGVDNRQDEYRAIYTNAVAIVRDLGVTIYFIDFDSEVKRWLPQPSFVTVTPDPMPGEAGPPWKVGQRIKLKITVVDQMFRPIAADLLWNAPDEVTIELVDQTHATATVSAAGTWHIQAVAGRAGGGTNLVVE